MTRRQKNFIIIFSSVAVGAILFIALIMLWVVSISKQNPNYYYNVKWTSTDPKIEIVVKSKSFYNENPNAKKDGYLMVGEDEIEVYWQCVPLHHNFYIRKRENDDVLIRGTYSYTGTNTLTVSVKSDFIFDRNYEQKTITFKKVKLD